MAVCHDWRRAAREDLRFHALHVRAPLRVLHAAQDTTDPVLPEIDLSSAQVCAPALHTRSAPVLCTPALYILCICPRRARSAPALHPLHAPAAHAPISLSLHTPAPEHLLPPSPPQAARFTDVALRLSLSAAGARLTSLTLHQLPEITASGLAPLRLLPKLETVSVTGCAKVDAHQLCTHLPASVRTVRLLGSSVGRAGLDQLLARGFDELDMFACKQCDGVTRTQPTYHIYPD